MRELIDITELSRRMAARRPIVMDVPGMPDDRIVCETITEIECGPQMRRMTFYAMSPNTFHRATAVVRSRWGVWPDVDEQHCGPILGRSIIIPMLLPDGRHDWKIEL